MTIHTVACIVCSVLGYLMVVVTICRSLGLSCYEVPRKSPIDCINYVEVVEPQQMFIWIVL